jgi:hypothetical protein
VDLLCSSSLIPSIAFIALVEFESKEFEHIMCSYHGIRCIGLSSPR